MGLNLNPGPAEDGMACCFPEYPMVCAVAEDSAAARAGVRPRDRICKIGSEPVLHRQVDDAGVIERLQRSALDAPRFLLPRGSSSQYKV